MKDEQFNTLVELIGNTNEKMDKQYSALTEKIEKTNETLKRHAEEMERRFENMNNMLIATDQTNKMYLAALNKEDERLEAVMLEVKKESEERDKMLDERLKVANL